MLTLTCPYCGVHADETELSPGHEAHPKRHGPGSSDTNFDSHMFARKNPNQAHHNRSITAVLSAALFPRGWRVE